MGHRRGLNDGANRNGNIRASVVGETSSDKVVVIEFLPEFQGPLRGAAVFLVPE